MNVLVVGATGYVGRAAAEELMRLDHRVRGTVRDRNAARLPVGVEAVQADVKHPETLVAAAKDADAVIYAVQYPGDDQFAVESAALQALTRALAPRRARMIYTSGVSMYGNTFPRSADERTAANPIAIVAKRPDLEAIVLASVPDGLHGIVIRPGHVFGRGGGLPAMWVRSAHESGAATIVGDGGNHWPVIHIDDLARFFAAALERAAPGSVYVAVDESEFTVQAMAEAASRGAGKHGNVEHRPVDDARKTLGHFAEALALDQAASSAKARAELGWAPRGPSILEELEHGSYAGTVNR